MLGQPTTVVLREEVKEIDQRPKLSPKDLYS